MDIEILTIYLGHSLGIIVGLYIGHKVNKAIGISLALCFIAFLQGALVAAEWDYHAQVSSCLETVKDYYACLPIGVKVSIHVSQAATVLLPICILLLGKVLARQSS